MDNLGLRDQVVVLTEKVDQLERIIEKLVTKHEFEPVRMIVYGLATAVLTSVMMAILAKVIIT